MPLQLLWTRLNRVFKPYFDHFVVVFIDDILVYSKSRVEHELHLHIVLQTLKREKYYAKLTKCDFWLHIVDFLEHIISKDGVLVDPRKVEAVVKWSRPVNVAEIQSFFSLAGYYRRFVERFSRIAGPLTCLTQKIIKFIWTEDCEQSFQDLKDHLMLAPILVLPSGLSGFVTYSDASIKGLGCMLIQNARVVAYASR